MSTMTKARREEIQRIIAECPDSEEIGEEYGVTAAELRALLATADMAEALRAECDIAREYNKLRNVKRGTGVLADWQRRLSAARAATDALAARLGYTGEKR